MPCHAMRCTACNLAPTAHIRKPRDCIKTGRQPGIMSPETPASSSFVRTSTASTPGSLARRAMCSLKDPWRARTPILKLQWYMQAYVRSHAASQCACSVISEAGLTCRPLQGSNR